MILWVCGRLVFRDNYVLNKNTVPLTAVMNIYIAVCTSDYIYFK